MESILTNDKNTQPPMPGSEFFIHNIDSAPAYWWLDDLWIVLAQAKDTGGRFSMMLELLPKGSGPGPHKHTWSDETYYMLDGEITFYDRQRNANGADRRLPDGAAKYAACLSRGR